MVRFLPILAALISLECFSQAINLKELDPKDVDVKREGAL